jgi:hypothetical protein
MDRLQELQSLVSSYNSEMNGGIDNSRPRTAASPFLIQCGNMVDIENILSKPFDLSYM